MDCLLPRAHELPRDQGRSVPAQVDFFLAHDLNGYRREAYPTKARDSTARQSGAVQQKGDEKAGNAIFPRFYRQNGLGDVPVVVYSLTNTLAGLRAGINPSQGETFM